MGRLDFGSEGLLILTNDGEFTKFMTKAGVISKVYHVKVAGQPAETRIARLRRGSYIDNERLAPCEIKSFKSGENPWYEVTLHQGRNQQIRRMFQAIGHPVEKLRRVRIGFLEDEKLRPGEWRFLTEHEVSQFRRDFKKVSSPRFRRLSTSAKSGVLLPLDKPLEPMLVQMGMNENPFGPSPLAIEAMRFCAAMTAIGILTTRATSSAKSSRAASGVGGRSHRRRWVPVICWVVAFNAVLSADAEVLTSDGSFVVYYLLAGSSGSAHDCVPLKDYAYDLEAMAAEINRTDATDPDCKSE